MLKFIDRLCEISNKFWGWIFKFLFCKNGKFNMLKTLCVSVMIVFCILRIGFEDLYYESMETFASSEYEKPEVPDVPKYRPSHIVLDIDGEGVEIINKHNRFGVYFDHDANSFAEITAWPGKGNAFLVRDINGNGKIDNGSKLFGDNTILSNGEKAANGFDALTELDANKDGVFDTNDEAWSEVKVWQDDNSNAVVDSGELKSLDDVGISRIDLDRQAFISTYKDGKDYEQVGTFRKTDGTTGSVNNVWFNVNPADRIDLLEIEIPADIAELPEVAALGNVHNLHKAMVLDESGKLKELVISYTNEQNAIARKKMIDNIIFHWTEVQDIDPESRKPSTMKTNPIKDARYLEALERFQGRKYVNKWWIGREESNPRPGAAEILLEAYDKIAKYVSSRLEAQTHCRELMENIKFKWDDKSEKWNVNVSQAVEKLDQIAEVDIHNALQVLHNLEDIMKQQAIMYDKVKAEFQNSAQNSKYLSEYLQNFGENVNSGQPKINHRGGFE